MHPDLYDFHEIQEVRKAVIKFYSDVEDAIPADQEKFVFTEMFGFKLYAADGDVCFFGGWESKEMGGRCKVPWKYGSKPYSACGSSTKFRCNPQIFGSGADGKGICVDTGGTYAGLTNKCNDQTKSNPENLDTALGNFLKDPKKLEDLFNNIKKFCTRWQGEKKSKYDACESLEDRLLAINDRAQKLKGKAIADIPVQSAKKNKALGILDACQKHYEKENAGFWASMVKSERNIISGISDSFARCKQAEETKFENFKADLQGIEAYVAPKEIVRKANKAHLQSSIRSLLLSQIQYDSPFTPEKTKRDLLKKYPHLKGELEEIIDENIEKFSKSQKAIERSHFKPKHLIAKDFNDFGKRMNKICKNIKKDYKNVRDKGRVVNSDEENQFYDKYQDVINKEYAKFQKRE